MKNIFLLLLLYVSMQACTDSAPTASFDIATFSPPEGWKKEEKEGLITYTILDSAKTNFCVLVLNPSTASSGEAQKDFANDWNSLAKPFGVTDNPQTEATKASDGRDIIMGSAAFETDGNERILLLATYSGFGKAFSVMALMNSDYYQDEVSKFLEGMELAKTETPANAANNSETTGNNSSPKPSANINTSFAALKGWKQTKYSDATVFQSPAMECDNDMTFTISVFDKYAFEGNLKTQATDILNRLYPPENGDIEKTVSSTVAPGVDCITTKFVGNNSPDHFEAEILVAKSGDEISVYTLESKHTEYKCWCDPLECIEMKRVWKKFKDFVLLNKEPTQPIAGIPEELIGIWAQKIHHGTFSSGLWNVEILEEFTFRANGYVKRKQIYQRDVEGTFSIQGNQLTVNIPDAPPETFDFRIEKELPTYYLLLTDGKGNENKLIYQGE